MAWISVNAPLTQEEMENNATEFYYVMTDYGWTAEAIAGMLGNMESESKVNPGAWQNYEVNPEMGFGLVQWTPATKFIDWATDLGLDYTSGDVQCQRFVWEVENNQQWISTTAYPMSFEEFTQSTDAPYDLAGAFLYNYERPKTPDPDTRGKQAEEWYTFITGLPPKPPEPKGESGLPLYMYLRRF